MRKTYFHKCPDCGDNLDPSEQCKCLDDITENKINKVVETPEIKKDKLKKGGVIDARRW